MHEDPKVTGDFEFRTSEQEVVKLLEECRELRRTLQSIGLQVGRIEKRLKTTFPLASKTFDERRRAKDRRDQAALSPEIAIAEFDKIVRLAASGATSEAERYVEDKSASDLFFIAKEVGVSFPSNKPSIRAVREAVLGKVRESLLLGRSSPRR
jgi:hypothetical protein